jgi:hypothetical protein
MCPGVDSASKNEYQENSWGQKRPVRKGEDLTTFIVPKVMKNPQALNLPDPQGPVQASSGKTLPLPLPVTQDAGWPSQLVRTSGEEKTNLAYLPEFEPRISQTVKEGKKNDTQQS